MKNNHKVILLTVFTLGLTLFLWNILERQERIIMSLAYLYGVYYTKLLNFLDNDR